MLWFYALGVVIIGIIGIKYLIRSMDKDMEGY